MVFINSFLTGNGNVFMLVMEMIARTVTLLMSISLFIT